MACYSNKTKLCCEKVVLIIGIVELIFGIAAGVWGFLGSNHGADIDFTGLSFPSPTVAFAIMALIGGLLTVIVGLLALCTAKYKVCCFACPFMVLSLIMCVVMLVVAFMGLLASGYKDQAKKLICTEKMQKGWQNLEFYNGIIYGEMIDRFMCTDKCPCPVLDAATLDKYNALLAKRSVNTATASKRSLYVAAAAGVTPVNNWQECLKTPYMTNFIGVTCKTPGNEKNWACKAALELQVNQAQFYPKLEKSLNCSGACTQVIFGMARDVKEGPPSTDCISKMVDNLDKLKGVGAICLATGLILLVSFFAAIPLCSGFKNPDGK